MAQERVGEYEGASSLGEAGQAVLMNPRLDLAIVKRAGHNLLGIHRRRFTSDEARADFVYENVPELRDLDAAVDAWYNRDLPSANHRQGAHIAQNHLRTDPIERHFDGETNAGPLTLSVRVDREYGVKRYFHARRASRPATPNQLSRNSMAGYFRQKALGTNLLPPCLKPPLLQRSRARARRCSHYAQLYASSRTLHHRDSHNIRHSGTDLGLYGRFRENNRSKQNTNKAIMIVFTNIRTKSEHRYLIHTEPKEKIVAGHIELSQRNLEEKQK